MDYNMGSNLVNHVYLNSILAKNIRLIGYNIVLIYVLLNNQIKSIWLLLIIQYKS